MTPGQKIKREILAKAIELNDDIQCDEEITAENIDELYDRLLVDEDRHWDFESEFRGSGEDTGLKCDWSRHYESNAVARQLSDGTWVGWTYWFGGGKHGEPEAIEWIDDAYEVECHQETRVVNVFKNKVAEQATS